MGLGHRILSVARLTFVIWNANKEEMNMQVFKLVKPGYVDRLIAFNELPETMMRGIRRGTIAGWPRHWRDFMGVPQGDQVTMPFYILDYITINADKEKWQEIVSYVKRNVDPSVRLLDKMEAMAVAAAQDSYSDLSIEPEDLPIIPLPEKSAPVEEEVQTIRRRRKPKSEEVAA
jgi:hypothetical protein